MRLPVWFVGRIGTPSYRACLVIAVTCLTAFPAHSQEEKIRTIPFEGPEIFAHILHSEGITPLKSSAEASEDPRQTVVILFGDPISLAKIRKEILYKEYLTNENLKEDYLTRGGNLCIATDHNLFMGEYMINIVGTQMTQPENLYRQTPQCPWLPYDPTRAGYRPSDHPLFDSLKNGIATNCPSRIEFQKGTTRVRPLLEFSNPPKPPAKPPSPDRAPYMAVSTTDGPQGGRVLIVAGHGMFMNGMMLQPDNDNYAFARNTVRWLTEGKDGKRKVLFVYDGRIIQKFDMNLSPPPPPIPIPTVKMVNRLLRGLEDERFFHRALKELLGRRLGIVVSALLGVFTLGVLLYGVKRLIAGRSHLETAVPCMVGVHGETRSNGSIEERGQALLRKGDFWDESHQLALEWFRAEFDVTPDRWQAGVQANFRAGGSFLARWRLQRQADFALRLARAADPMPVPRHQFFVLIETLKELSRAQQAGRLVLLVEGKNVRQA